VRALAESFVEKVCAVEGNDAELRLSEAASGSEEVRFAAGTKWVESDLVFTSSIATALNERNVRREFEAILTKANLPPMRIHDLRHTCASLCWRKGSIPAW